MEESRILKRVTKVSIGKLHCFTRDGEFPLTSPTDPLLTVGPSIAAVLPENLKSYAYQRLLQTTETRIARVKSIDEIEIDGLDGFEMIALGNDVSTDAAILVYHVMLFDQGGYILIQGLVGQTSSEEYLNAFKAMARSLRRN